MTGYGHTSRYRRRTEKYADIRPLSAFLTLHGHFIKQTVGVNLEDAAVNKRPLGKKFKEFSLDNNLARRTCG